MWLPGLVKANNVDFCCEKCLVLYIYIYPSSFIVGEVILDVDE